MTSSNSKIPKIIHFCWLSGDPYPNSIQKCIDSWSKVMPDYTIKLWDKNSFDIESVIWVKQACESRKWAFAADYIRLYALYTEGGIYFDSDVLIKKRFDDFLDNDFFSGVEYKSENKWVVQAAILGGKKGAPILKSLMKYYENNSFILPDGEFNIKEIAPSILAKNLENYGFKYEDKKQMLTQGGIIYPSKFFACNPQSATQDSYAIHNCAHSWFNFTMKEKVMAIIVSLKRGEWKYIFNLVFEKIKKTLYG